MVRSKKPINITYCHSDEYDGESVREHDDAHVSVQLLRVFQFCEKRALSQSTQQPASSHDSDFALDDDGDADNATTRWSRCRWLPEARRF